MSRHDDELVEQARKVKGIDYAGLIDLQGRCLTPEGRDEIEKLLVRMYHREEAMEDMI